MEVVMQEINDLNSTKSFSPCLLCGPTMVEVRSLKDRKGDSLRTVICVSCGLIWSDPRPDESELKNFYSQDYRLDYPERASARKSLSEQNLREERVIASGSELFLLDAHFGCLLL
jgi:transcription elongation factor Elf1